MKNIMIDDSVIRNDINKLISEYQVNLPNTGINGFSLSSLMELLNKIEWDVLNESEIYIKQMLRKIKEVKKDDKDRKAVSEYKNEVMLEVQYREIMQLLHDNIQSLVDYIMTCQAAGIEIPFRFMLDDYFDIYIYRIDLDKVKSNPFSREKINPINWVLYRDEILSNINDSDWELNVNLDYNFNIIKYIKIPDFVSEVIVPPEALRTMLKAKKKDMLNLNSKAMDLSDMFIPMFSTEEISEIDDIEASEEDEENGLNHKVPNFSIITGSRVNKADDRTTIVMNIEENQLRYKDNLLDESDPSSPDPDKTTGVYMVYRTFDSGLGEPMMQHYDNVDEINGFLIED